MADARRKSRPPKPSFKARMIAHGREARHLGVTLKDEPRAFPSEVLRIFRRFARTVWRARGGGFYACGFVITFVLLEIRMFFLDIFEAEGIGDYLQELVTEKVFKYLGDSIENTVSAFIWPVYFIELYPPWGMVCLGAMYVVFSKLLKKPIEGWLFSDEEAVEGTENQALPR